MLRFTKNKNPLPNSTLGTLGEFYDMHLRSEHVSSYVSQPGRGTKPKSGTPIVLDLELYIDMDAVSACISYS